MRDAVERLYIPPIDRIIYGPQQFIKQNTTLLMNFDDLRCPLWKEKDRRI